MDKHTPAPHHIREAKYGNLVIEYDVTQMRSVTLAIVECADPADPQARAVQRANADLYAAAPQMLKEARRALAWLTLPTGASLSEASIESARNALRAAISAATGNATPIR